MPFYADRGQHPRRPLTPSAAAAEGHSRNVQKSVTQIIYLGPLPTAAPDPIDPARLLRT